MPQQQQQQQKPTGTLTIDHWDGRLTRYLNGDINSGFAYQNTSNGYIPFGNPGQLSWQENPIQIDPAGSVITDLIMCGKERVESGISYVYCVGHTGRVYKIQVNNPSVHNPNYDNPVLLTTLTSNSPTFKAGGFIEFFGATNRIYIGHDVGVTYINFDGSSETFVGSAGSWTQGVPRPLHIFAQYLYAGNGNNIAQIIDPGTVGSYTQLSPGFPSNTQVRDIDITPDGNYLSFAVSRLAIADQTSAAVDTTVLTNTDAYVFKWNGTDMAATTYNIFASYSITANKTFGNYEYNFGYDIAGAGLFNPLDKAVTLNLANSPCPNGIVSDGSIIGWAAPEFVNGFNKLGVYLYGAFDAEITTGLWRQLQMPAQGTETDVIRNPFGLFVSNFILGASTSNYAGGLISLGKVYYSTLEASATTTKYKLYKFYTVSAGVSTPQLGTYQTQCQLFSKKVTPTEVRIYGVPWVANNSFTVSLIGSSGTPIANSTKTFTAGTNLVIGNDFVAYNPGIAPTYALGFSITNAGTANFTLNKVEGRASVTTPRTKVIFSLFGALIWMS